MKLVFAWQDGFDTQALMTAIVAQKVAGVNTLGCLCIEIIFYADATQANADSAKATAVSQGLVFQQQTADAQGDKNVSPSSLNLKSPDGSVWKLEVDNLGILTTTKVL